MSAFVPSLCSPSRLICSSSSSTCSHFPPTPYHHTTSTTNSIGGTLFIPKVHQATEKQNSSCTTSTVSKRQTVKNVITTERLANKSFQLEEDEDESSCTTAVYFHEDGSVTLGRTDGPEPDRVKASWSYSDKDGELYIDIERYFQGERGIEFMVKRILRGHLDESRKNLSELPVFEGAMYPYPTDFEKHSEVGFFAMILATDDLPTEDFDVSKEN